MDRFLEIQAFAAVVDAGSFVGAAEALGLSKAALSRHVGALEARHGVRLLHRTTRRLALTEEGQRFLARCREVLAGLDEAEQELTSATAQATGLLRINAPVAFGTRHLAVLWGPFRSRHPGVQLDITLADRIVDLVEEGYDLAVRIAALPSSSLVSRRLATARTVLCASPRYLAEHGTPRSPGELAGHVTLAYSYLSTGDEWRFEGPDGAVAARVRPSVHSNSGDTCRIMALAHQGIILEPDFLVSEDLAAGTLVELMPAYRSPQLGIFAVYPTRKHVAPKVRAMVDYLVEALAAHDEGWLPGR